MTNEELDKLAAENVMGWIWYCEGFYVDEEDNHARHYNWQPTRNIAQALECLENSNCISSYFRKDGTRGPWRVSLSCILEQNTDSRLTGHSAATAFVLPLAIVKACLKAKGIAIE